MYAGKLVERGPARRVFGAPAHPFTMGLLYAVPESRGAAQLVSIPGATPDLRNVPPGCAFAERCPFATDRCTTETPRLQPIDGEHEAACHYVEQSSESRSEASQVATWSRVAERLRLRRGAAPGRAS